MKYLGTIATNNNTKNNTNTATPFVIPAPTAALRLLTTQSDVYVKVDYGSTLTSSTSEMLLTANVPMDVPLAPSQAINVVASYSAGSSSVRVFALQR